MLALLVLFAPSFLYDGWVALATAIGAPNGIIAVDEMVNEQEKTDTDSKFQQPTQPTVAKKCPAIPNSNSRAENFQ